MAIEWDEDVTVTCRVAMQVVHTRDPGQVVPMTRSATVDDLRRACEAAGLTLASAQHAEDLEKLGREMNEVVAQRDAARANYHAAVDRALDAHRVLGAMHNEGTLDAARRVVAERDELRARAEQAEAELAKAVSERDSSYVGILLGEVVTT